ncbi:Uncharacterized protein APZ42_003181, partial [Daphnia magna]
EEKRVEGAVGGEDSEEDDTLQLLYESMSIEEPTIAPTEPTRQSRARGRGLLMHSPEGPRERSISRIAWIRRLAEQQKGN